jgi:outer membrane receptor for ferrienterochelin and colicin
MRKPEIFFIDIRGLRPKRKLKIVEGKRVERKLLT